MPVPSAVAQAHSPAAAALRPARSPLQGVAGSITRRPRSGLYRLGLTLVAVSLVLLPAAYTGLIVLVGWGVCVHAVSHVALVGAGFWFGIPLYVGPILVGLTVIAFLVKPLFAIRQAAPAALELSPEREPLLFAFIERICGMVEAPLPRRVAVNCVANATAGLRRGLVSFFGQDLTLTIGLPLVAGLSTRQFAGVLAHEFGHFAQGAGMRLTYVIRQVNCWLFRVVHERDKWDAELECAAQQADIRSAPVIYPALGCVWLSRSILWILAHVGHAVSCFMLRQMEYDADRCECLVAGSDAFRETALRIAELNASSGAAFAALRAGWKAQRLPDSLPLFIVGTVATMPPEVREQIGRHLTDSRTAVFDTHPSDADRIRAAIALDATGVLRSSEPAAALFRDFPSLCRRVTRHSYEKEYALAIRHRNLVDTETYLRESSAAQAAQGLFASYFAEVNTVFRPVSISRGQTCTDAEEEMALLRSARDRMKAAVCKARSSNEAQERLEDRIVEATKALALARAGFTFRPEQFELQSGSRESAAQAIARLEFQRTRSGVALEEFSACAAARLSAALRQLDRPSHAGRIPEAPKLRREVPALVGALEAVAQILPTLFQLGRNWAACQVLLANRANHAEPAKVDHVVGELVGRMWGHLTEVRLRIRGIAYPFPHARGAITLERFVEPDAPAGNQRDAVLNEGLACLDRLFPLYHELLCQLAQIAVQVEKSLAPESVPSPDRF